ncbi:hypothetical protein MSG28_007505 [Choristoneura fumiferana]|nr:hypothetical protein MSG28_007505 [Choristoneura fumiferana]
MKLLVFCSLVAAVAAAPAPAGNSGDVQILKSVYDKVGTYGFKYGFDQSDGSKAEAYGELINEGKENAALVIKGFYEFFSPDGVRHSVKYVADEGGYQPTIEEGPGALVVVALVMSVAAAAPQQRPQRQSQGAGSEVQILRFDSDNNGIDSYNFAYEQSNGQKQQEQGELRNAGAENESIAVKGSYAWVGPDGVTYIVTYVADENGFQPTIEQGPGGAVPGAVVASLLG